MIKSVITDGKGTGKKAMVDDQESLVVSVTTCPPLLVQKNKIYRSYLANSAGSTDMRVNGSVTNVEFYVSASGTADRYITQLSFIIADAGATLNKFGAITALTNGCKLTYERLGETITIHSALKTNWDFVRLSLGNPAFGQLANAFIASNVFGVSEGVIPVIDFTKILPPYGIKLDKGSTQRLTLTVRDNCTAVDQFDCIAYGFDRFE
jgi:hypothetical protein